MANLSLNQISDIIQQDKDLVELPHLSAADAVPSDSSGGISDINLTSTMPTAALEQTLGDDGDIDMENM